MKHKAGDIIKCKRKGCSGTFVFNPKWKFQKYCSENCSAIMNAKRQKIRKDKQKFELFGKDKYGRYWEKWLNDSTSYAGVRRFHDDGEHPLYDQICYEFPKRSRINVSGN